MIVLVPVPAVAGLNTPPLTPVPPYVPPAGLPPVNVIGEPFMHAVEGTVSETDGVGFTVIVFVPVPEQPDAFVYEYEIVNVPAPAVAGLNEFPDTPVPLYVPPDGDPPDNVTALPF